MIKCNHYKFKPTEAEFLLYGEELSLPEDEFELLHEDIDPSLNEYRTLEILSFDDCLSRIFNKRSRDKILEEAGIISFEDFAGAYYLLRNKQLNKPKRIRDLVEEKYSEIIQLIKDETV